MNALTSPAVESSRGWLSARLRNSARGLTGPPKQVVVLGSGFDTRAWRIPLQPETKWLEVDTAEVVNAKKHGLKSSNVELTPGSGAGIHVLRSSQWNIHVADLNVSQDWGALLEEYGFDAALPVVWILESVLMYLPQENLHDLLQDLASISATGSSLIGNCAVNRSAELLAGDDHDGACGTYPAEMIKLWQSTLPRDPRIPLAEAGWSLQISSTQTEIANQVCQGDVENTCSFKTGSSSTDNPLEVYFVAKKK